MLVHRGPGGAWIWQRGTATFHIAPDARRVRVYPEGEADERAIGLGLAGPVLLYIVHKLGRPSLHAGAVVTEHGAVGFLGQQGQGKSTITASFLRHGAALLTDDALLTMPPEPLEYQGHEAIGAFLSDRFATHAGRRVVLVRTRANSQPAFGHYIEDPHASILRSFGVLVLTLEGDRIAAVTRFGDTAILPHFGLPRTLRD